MVDCEIWAHRISRQTHSRQTHIGCATWHYMAKAIAFQLVFSQRQDAGYCNSLKVLDYTHMQKLSDRVWSNKRVDFLSLRRNHYKRSAAMGVSTQIDEMHHLCHLGKPQFWEHLEKSSTNAAGHHNWPACDGFIRQGIGEDMDTGRRVSC